MQAYSLDGRTPVIQTGSGSQGDAWIMDALNSMQERNRLATIEKQRQDDEARKRAAAFGGRLTPDLTDEQRAQAAQSYTAIDPAVTAADLAPYTAPVPQGPGAQLKKTVGDWQQAIMPQFLQTLQNTPEKVDPQLFMTFYPFLSSGDKTMDPGIVKFITHRYIAANEDKLPPDFVQQYKYEAKLQQTPQEIAQEQTALAGHKLTSDAARYGHDTALEGVREGITAQAPLRAAETQRNVQQGEAEAEHGRLWGGHADVNQVNNHPAILAQQAHIDDLQKQRDEALKATHVPGLGATERSTAQNAATQYDQRIATSQKMLEDMKAKMRTSLGIDESDSGGGDDSEGTAPAGPTVTDMRGSNVPNHPVSVPPQPTRAPMAAPVQPTSFRGSRAGGSGQQISKRQVNQKTGATRVIYSNDGGATWHP